jgi:hypothetical protein
MKEARVRLYGYSKEKREIEIYKKSDPTPIFDHFQV